MVVDCLILVVSASGTLQENKKRTQKLRVLLYIRVVLFFPGMCFSVFGLGVAFHPQLANQPACASKHIFQLLAAYSIVTTVLMVLNIVSYIVFMDPLGCCSPGPIGYVSEMKYNAKVKNSGSPEVKHGRGLARQGQSSASISIDEGFRRIIRGRRTTTHRDTQHTLYNRRTTQLWQNRINKLTCGSLTRSLTGNAKSSVHAVAKLFSTFFENTNYTLSDLTTAIFLVSKEQKDLCRRGHLFQRNVRKVRPRLGLSFY